MNISFYKSHIETISDLQKLAKKHNCSISIGTTNETHHPDDFEINEQMEKADNSIKILSDNFITINSGVCDKYSLWFELMDARKKTTKYNTLVYTSYDGFIEFEKDEVDQLPDEIKGEFYTEYADDTIFFFFTTTEVYGFEKRTHKVNVYRSGIALREFSYLVCDYLGEPRIERTY